jgi:hypothetical protein
MNEPIIKKHDQLTPIEKRGEYYFKRDDLFQPLSCRLNGSKMRQALHVIGRDAELIKQSYNGIVATTSGVTARQGYLLTRCAHHFDLQTIVGVGTAPEKARRQKPFRLLEKYGGRIEQLAKIGYRSVLEKRLDELAAKNNWYVVGFGFKTDDLSRNADQVTDFPPIHNLVIPCGSGVTASAVLLGVSRMRHPPKNIFVVQIAGGKRKIEGHGVNFHHVMYTCHPYTKLLNTTYHGLELDQVYEAKVFEWMQQASFIGNTLFWVVGNFNSYRK